VSSTGNVDRRALLLGGAAAIAASTVRGVAGAQSADEDARLHALLDRLFYERLQADPESATRLGLDTGSRAALRSRLNDESLAARERTFARAAAERRMLGGIDRSKLSRQAAIDYDVLEYQLTAQLNRRRFTYGTARDNYAPYILSHLTGPYRELPEFIEGQHPIANAGDADAYLARLSALAKAIDDGTARQRADAAKGVFAPDFVLDTALRLMATLRDRPAAETSLVRNLAAKSAAIGLAGGHVARATRIVEREVFPALDRQRALLSELRGKATHEAGCWRLPDGDAYYASAAENATTVPMSGDDIHRLGLAQVADLSGKLDALLKQAGLTQGSVGERLVALNRRPDQLFPNTDAGKLELVALLNRQIAEMAKRLPEQFAYLPNATVEARRVPPSIEAGAPGGYYQAAPLDGSRPGVYFINLRDTFNWPKFATATLTYHEAAPGHHLQGMTALETGSIPLIRRRAYFGAYSEGWALYSEQLADEIGIYEGNPLGRIGSLQSLLFRATRLVVDSGMHAKRWSREKATEYLLATTGMARDRGQSEIDRYTIWPGQACSYKVGHTKWVELRDAARARAGAAWDPRSFHEVLRLGPMPLAVLERVVRSGGAQ
jgi:uncharacterized protein (DUF885 family)